MNKAVQKTLLEHNKEYYERMVASFPDEMIWQKALDDTNNLLAVLEKSDPLRVKEGEAET